jgi:hypothetical protein
VVVGKLHEDLCAFPHSEVTGWDFPSYSQRSWNSHMGNPLAGYSLVGDKGQILINAT